MISLAIFLYSPFETLTVGRLREPISMLDSGVVYKKINWMEMSQTRLSQSQNKSDPEEDRHRHSRNEICSEEKLGLVVRRRATTEEQHSSDEYSKKRSCGLKSGDQWVGLLPVE